MVDVAAPQRGGNLVQLLQTPIQMLWIHAIPAAVAGVLCFLFLNLQRRRGKIQWTTVRIGVGSLAFAILVFVSAAALVPYDVQY